MEKTNLLTLVVTLTVGIILAGSLLMPVITDATETEKTFVNDGTYRMTDKDDNYTITYDAANLKFIINDVDYPFADFPQGRWTLISTDAFMFRFQAYANEGYTLYISDTSATTAIANTGTTTPRTWTFDDGTYTGYDGVTTRDYTSTSFRGYDPNGDYVMTDGTHKPVLKGDSSIIIGHGLTPVGGTNAPFYIVGTVDDGVTITTKDTITVSDVAVNAEASSRYEDCYTLNSITFKATLSDTTVSATYDRIIVPHEVTVNVAEPLDDASIVIMNAIPVLIIIGLVLAGVGAIFIRNRD